MSEAPAPELLAKLITDNLGLIYTFAMRRSYTHRDEIVQQACLGIMRSKTYDPSISVTTFLHWQVRGAFAHLRKRENAATRSKARAPSLVVEANQEEAADIALIRDRVDRLPPRQRQAVTMMLNGENRHQIGKAMGVSHQAAYQTIDRARKALASGKSSRQGGGIVRLKVSSNIEEKVA